MPFAYSVWNAAVFVFLARGPARESEGGPFESEKRTSMKSGPIELPAIASCPVENVSRDVENLMGPNNLSLEAFIVKLACAFVSAVVVLVAVSLLLVVAGYAGSIFAPEVQPKTLSASWARK